mgnify:FL=1
MLRLLLKLRIRRDKEIIKRLVTKDLNNNLDIIAAIIIKTLSILKSKDLDTKNYLEGIFKQIPSISIEIESFKINLLKLVNY